MSKISHHISLITGASRGIGRAIANALGKNGSIIVGTSTSNRGVHAITTYLNEEGITGYGIKLDVNDQTSIDTVIKDINQKYNFPTILVNNAGITCDNLLMRMKDKEWLSIINTNLNAIFRMSRACLRGMIKRKGGRIINIASVVAVSGNSGQTNYAAAKAGILGFTKSLAREVSCRGITVNAIAPGFIDTDMTRKLSAKQKESLLARIPLARFGTPAEIGAVAAFLASDNAAYITGETLHVNGGIYMV